MLNLTNLNNWLVNLQIENGSTNVRVGSTIFGARVYKNKEPAAEPVSEAAEKLAKTSISDSGEVKKSG